jgi:hypothetical protein
VVLADPQAVLRDAIGDSLSAGGALRNSWSAWRVSIVAAMGEK